MAESADTGAAPTKAPRSAGPDSLLGRRIGRRPKMLRRAANGPESTRKGLGMTENTLENPHCVILSCLYRGPCAVVLGRRSADDPTPSLLVPRHIFVGTR